MVAQVEGTDSSDNQSEDKRAKAKGSLNKTAEAKT